MMLRRIGVYVGVFLTIITLFFLSMIVVYSIPNSWIETHLNESLSLINSEGTYPRLFFGGKNVTTQLDNFTDKLMLNKNWLDESQGVVYSAMDNKNYARYWHGYQIFLRPLLVFFSYAEIRLLNIFVFFSLFFIVLLRMYKKLNLVSAMCFFFSILCMSILVIPVSLQFISIFNITFVSIIFLLSFKDITKCHYIPLCFMVIGMLTNFFDLLTAPLITLGIPMVVYLLLCIRTGENSFKKSIINVVLISVAWFLGFGLCWVFKWLISSAVLKRNVIENAIKAIFFRTAGDVAENKVDRLEAIELNFTTLLDSNQFLQILIITVFIILFLCAVIFHVGLKKIGQSSIFLIIACFPYVWYFVLANHSQIHYWFTFRAQWITLFSLLIFMTSSIDNKRILSFLNRVKEKIRRIHDRIVQKK